MPREIEVTADQGVLKKYTGLSLFGSGSKV